jgi:hypothetical protein
MNLTEDIKKLLEAVKRNRVEVASSNENQISSLKMNKNSKNIEQQRKATKNVLAAT